MIQTEIKEYQSCHILDLFKIKVVKHMLLQVKHSFFYISLHVIIPNFHTKSIFGLFQLVSNTTQIYSDLKYSYSAMENLKDVKRSKSLSHVAVVQKMQIFRNLSIAAK